MTMSLSSASPSTSKTSNDSPPLSSSPSLIVSSVNPTTSNLSDTVTAAFRSSPDVVISDIIDSSHSNRTSPTLSDTPTLFNSSALDDSPTSPLLIQNDI